MAKQADAHGHVVRGSSPQVGRHAEEKVEWWFESTSIHKILRDGAVVARKAHNLEVGGSSPSPATKKKNGGLAERSIAAVLMSIRADRRETPVRNPPNSVEILESYSRDLSGS